MSSITSRELSAVTTAQHAVATLPTFTERMNAVARVHGDLLPIEIAWALYDVGGCTAQQLAQVDARGFEFAL